MRAYHVMAIALLCFALVGSTSAGEYRVDADASSVIFHVGKTGLMSGAGHEHDVKASRFNGTVAMDPRSAEGSKLSLSFPSSGLKVIPDKEPEGDAPKVQAAMEGPECLDVKRFPNIEFRSTKVAAKPSGDNAWDVTISGELELHGQRKPITIPAAVSLQGDTLTAKGNAIIKQTDFGITPISAAGGTINVKDELAMGFTIVAEGTGQHPADKPAPDKKR
jgi:polyisoprenoid-binding protein YceI